MGEVNRSRPNCFRLINCSGVSGGLISYGRPPFPSPWIPPVFVFCESLRMMCLSSLSLFTNSFVKELIFCLLCNFHFFIDINPIKNKINFYVFAFADSCAFIFFRLSSLFSTEVRVQTGLDMRTR